jgi:hypothetical protein
VSPELVAAVFAGLVALISAVGTITARRSQRRSDDLRAVTAENRELRSQQRLSDQYLGRLMRLMDLRGIPIPKPPEGLFDDAPDIGTPAAADDDEAPALDRAGRRHRADT